MVAMERKTTVSHSIDRSTSIRVRKNQKRTRKEKENKKQSENGGSLDWMSQHLILKGTYPQPHGDSLESSIHPGKKGRKKVRSPPSPPR